MQTALFSELEQRACFSTRRFRDADQNEDRRGWKWRGRSAKLGGESRLRLECKRATNDKLARTVSHGRRGAIIRLPGDFVIQIGRRGPRWPLKNRY